MGKVKGKVKGKGKGKIKAMIKDDWLVKLLILVIAVIIWFTVKVTI